MVSCYCPQVFVQPVFSLVESWAAKKWPKSKFVTEEYVLELSPKWKFSFNLLRLTWRSSFVMLSVVLAIAMPFFNDILAFLGAMGFWPLTVFFPIGMYISRNKIERWSWRWLGLELLNAASLLVSIAAACGSVQGLGQGLKDYKPFKVED